MRDFQNHPFGFYWHFEIQILNLASDSSISIILYNNLEIIVAGEAL